MTSNSSSTSLGPLTFNPDFIAEPTESLLARLQDWTLPKVLRGWGQTQPDAPALQFEGGEVLSYAELLARTETLAANLLALGVKKGDRVALIMENSLELTIAWFAVSFVGAIEVPVNVALRGTFLTHVMNNSAAEIAIIDPALLPRLVETRTELRNLRELVLNGATETSLPWPARQLSDLMFDRSGVDLEALRRIEIRHDDPAAIMYTSGTTGPAKGVLIPHAQMYIWAVHMVNALRLMPRDVFYVVLPMFHANAQIMQVYAAMIAGSKVALYKGFSSSRWVKQAIECGATVSSLLGVLAQFIFDRDPSAEDADLPISRIIAIPMPTAIASRFRERFKVDYIEAYGMTEICLPILGDLDDRAPAGSCGRPLKEWYEVDIVDPATDVPVPANTIGEIVVRPKHPWTMMLSYYGMEDRTVKAMRNLWFHTGDSGSYDADGYYYFADRLQDRIRRRGENISSYELEAAASEYAPVLEAAAVAVPAQEGEDEIKLCVVTVDGTLDFQDFLDHCRKRMAYFAVPRHFHVFAEFPKTASGKVLKRILRDTDGHASWDRVAAGIHIGRDG